MPSLKPSFITCEVAGENNLCAGASVRGWCHRRRSEHTNKTMIDGPPTQTSDEVEDWLKSDKASIRQVNALVIAWSMAEPQRVGEAALLPLNGKERVLGRGPARANDERLRLEFEHQRPGQRTSLGPLTAPQISYDQLAIRPSNGLLQVERTGRRELQINGRVCDKGTLRPGDTLTLTDQLLLLCVRRPLDMPPLHSFSMADHTTFGWADRYGLVGESWATWQLRDALAFNAGRDDHVLVLGPSGAGKELAASALHAMSPRRKGPWIARNAANFPETLIDAELFGNVRDYPNPGMRERPGLVGDSHGGTLLLDELGELPVKLQAHLLRVLDSDGNYQRLGESRGRTSDFRLVGATNRAPEELRHDLIGRLPLRVILSGLHDRREDIPLILNHLLRGLVANDKGLGERFFSNWDGRTGRARLDPALVEGLLRHDYTLHVRELKSLVWRAMSQSSGNFIEYTDSIRAALQGPHRETTPGELAPETIQAALDQCGGNQSAAYRLLGLKNRDVLYRLIKKHDIEVRK